MGGTCFDQRHRLFRHALGHCCLPCCVGSSAVVAVMSLARLKLALALVAAADSKRVLTTDGPTIDHQEFIATVKADNASLRYTKPKEAQWKQEQRNRGRK